MVKKFSKQVIVFLLLFSFLLIMCTGCKKTDNHNVSSQNSNDVLSDISSEVIDTDDFDIIVSNAQTSTVSSKNESGTTLNSVLTPTESKVSSKEQSKPENNSVVSSTNPTVSSKTESVVKENYVATSTEISSVNTDGETGDIAALQPEETVSSVPLNTTDSSIDDNTLTYTKFPKISTENLVVASTSFRNGVQNVEHSIPKDKAEMLANFINNSAFSIVDEEVYAGKHTSVPYFILYFHYTDKTKTTVIVSDYYQCSLCKGHFELNSDSITDFMTFVIGVDPFHFNKVYEDY